GWMVAMVTNARPSMTFLSSSESAAVMNTGLSDVGRGDAEYARPGDPYPAPRSMIRFSVRHHQRGGDRGESLGPAGQPQAVRGGAADRHRRAHRGRQHLLRLGA